MLYQDRYDYRNMRFWSYHRAVVVVLIVSVDPLCELTSLLPLMSLHHCMQHNLFICKLKHLVSVFSASKIFNCSFIVNQTNESKIREQIENTFSI